MTANELHSTQANRSSDADLAHSAFSAAAAAYEELRVQMKPELSKDTFSCLRGLQHFEALVSASGDESDAAVRSFYELLGYTPKDNTLKYARRTVGDLPALVDRVRVDILNGTLSATNVVDGSPDDLATLYPEISKSTARLLQHCLKHQVQLDRLDLSSLRIAFPFPIEEYNYFGRFLASHGADPASAMRHLRLSLPFLVRMRGLFETLSNEQPVLTTIQLRYNAASDDEPIRIQGDLATELRDLVVRGLGLAQDFCGGDKTLLPNGFSVIEVPRLPDVGIPDLSMKEKAKVAAALYDWLLFKTVAPILETRLKSAREQSEMDQITKDIDEQNTLLEGLREDLRVATATSSSAKKKGENSSKRKTIQEKIDTLERAVFQLRNRAEQLQSSFDNREPLINQLHDQARLLPDIVLFRANVAKALEDPSRKIVFSFLGGNTHGSSLYTNLLSLLPTAIETDSAPHKAMTKLLRKAAYIVFEGQVPSVSITTSNGAPKNGNGLRALKFYLSEISASVKDVLLHTPRTKQSNSLKNLIQPLQATLNLPGINSGKHLIDSLDRKFTSKPYGVAETLMFAFERAVDLNRDNLIPLLNTCRTLGLKKVPESCIRLAEERFHIPRDTFDRYEYYVSNYNPKQIGTLPDSLENLASFDRYLSFGLDTVGMSSEVARLEEQLSRTNIVALIDATTYHSDIRNRSVGAIGKSVEIEGAAASGETWGDYVPPGERVIRSLARRLIEREVTEKLRNYSLIGVVKPSFENKLAESFYRQMYGLDIEIRPNLAAINEMMSHITVFDSKVLLAIDAASVKNFEQYRRFIDAIARYDIKVILRTNKPFPGIPDVTISPFLPSQIANRIHEDRVALENRLNGLVVPEKTIIDFAADRVQQHRGENDDALNLTLQVLSAAGARARALQDTTIKERDIVEALSPIFNLPSPSQLRLRMDALREFASTIAEEVLGQERAIQQICQSLGLHLLLARDPGKPVTILCAGPTGVGKTELFMKLAKRLNLPFYLIEGAEFSEEHKISALMGSPPGYVGNDEGLLFQFLDKNSSGIVFIDEIEKMHPSIYTALMNFFDRASATSGAGKLIKRPGMIIIGACNAGADKLTYDMSAEVVRQILAEAFVDREGNPRPELVARFTPFLMLAIERSAFRRVVMKLLSVVGQRPGVIAANVRIVDADEAAVDLVYDEALNVCKWSDEAAKASMRKGMGFSRIEPGEDTDKYYNIRYVAQSVDRLLGDSLQELLLEQLSTGAAETREDPAKYRLVGDRETRTIRVVPCQEQDEPK